MKTSKLPSSPSSVHTASPKKTGSWQKTKTVAIAVDDSVDSEYAVQWALDNMIGDGDRVHLLVNRSCTAHYTAY